MFTYTCGSIYSNSHCKSACKKINTETFKMPGNKVLPNLKICCIFIYSNTQKHLG